jgi:GNAT superfamily N-acetyltransferase
MNIIRGVLMKIIDLDENNKPLYFLCLEDWSSEMKEAGSHKSLWYEKMKEKGFRVKLAVDDDGTAGGMIQYMPIEHSIVKGSDLFFIYCIWVHGHKEGRGNFQKMGFGAALLEAAEEDARSSGAKGMASWGLALPFWMKASWFKKHGYKKADRDGMSVLLWKSFSQDAVSPEWVRRRKKPERQRGKVVVTAFKNGWCPAQSLAFERAKRASAELGESVVFRGIDTMDKSNFDEWGIVDALFVDDREVRTGPPPSYEKIRKIIEKRVRKLK